jgi:hypothetical protein
MLIVMAVLMIASLLGCGTIMESHGCSSNQIFWGILVVLLAWMIIFERVLSHISWKENKKPNL